MSIRKASFVELFSTLLTGVSLGAAIPNWPAPASWSPPRSHGVTTLGDITNPLPFIGVTPCRIADTRGNGSVGQYGPPSLVANATRTFTIVGACSIPSGAAAVSFNFGALNVGGTGDLRIFPAGGGVPLVSTLNYNANTPNIANAAVVPLGTGGAITVQADTVSIDLIIDVNGYYSDGALGALAPGERFTLVGDVSGGSTGLLSVHNTEGVFGARAGYFVADSSGLGSTGIAGIETATTGLTAGVYGQASSSTTNTAGVSGVATSTTGLVYGIYGSSSSLSGDAAGVIGIAGSGAANISSIRKAGVRGESATDLGVLGLTSDNQCCGVAGQVNNSTGTLVAEGVLGYNGAAAYGVYAAIGTIACNGCTKLFVEPHPADPMKSIHYVSLEGNEAGTYFRGTARTVNGQAVITVPEDFRMVTDPDGLTVQLTPVAGPASMYVEDEDLNQIVVHSSRDVTFHYLVQGIRPDYKNFKPIVDGTDYMPQGPDAVMPAAWPEKVKRALISNGTYNRDGRVNMETAERLGWTKIWADWEAQARDAAANAAARAPMMSERR